MIGRRVELGLWIVAISLTVVAGVRARHVGTISPASVSQSALPALPAEMRERPEILVAAAEGVVANDPFRLDRRPSPVSYSPTTESAPAPPPRPPRPALAVTGIVGGPPWEALLEGLPGREGSVLVRRGDTVSGLRIRSITKDTVRISGMDTTWKLAVRRAWQ
jgi:hypothetical protein